MGENNRLFEKATEQNRRPKGPGRAKRSLRQHGMKQTEEQK